MSADTKKIHGAVRQVIMNELGVSRATIDAELKRLIEERVKTITHNIDIEGIVQRAIDLELNRWVYQDKNRRGHLSTMVKDIVEKMVKEKATAALDKIWAQGVTISVAGLEQKL